MATNLSMAISAARGELSYQGFDPSDCTAADAEKVLDDMARQNKQAGLWFWNATDNQISKFRKEWNNGIV